MVTYCVCMQAGVVIVSFTGNFTIFASVYNMHAREGLQNHPIHGVELWDSGYITKCT